MFSRPVIVVGGGLSGLAAAAALCVYRIPVLLLEQKPLLGGRVYSFRDPTTGAIVDNGQHAMIAGYDRTFAFLRRVGSAHQVTIQPRAELALHHPMRGFVSVRFPRLPSPLHLAWGVLAGSLFVGSEKAALLHAGWAVLRSGGEEAKQRLAGQTIDDWLTRVAQPREVRRSFWEPLAVSIMNEQCGKASALVFVRAIREAFLGGWNRAALALPSVGLSELFAEPSRTFIESQGGAIRCSVRVEKLVSAGNRVTAVHTTDGSVIECSGVILAVPPTRVEDLLPYDLRASGYLRGIGSFPLSPIVSIHLWFDHNPMRHAMLGLVDRRVQWVFKKNGYISMVISAAHSFVNHSNEELVNIAQSDIESVYGPRVGKPRHSLVIRERRATYSSSPAIERLRPSARTPMYNLFLAGDWTATGYPATIEGAILSGEAAARLAQKL